MAFERERCGLGPRTGSERRAPEDRRTGRLELSGRRPSGRPMGSNSSSASAAARRLTGSTRPCGSTSTARAGRNWRSPRRQRPGLVLRRPMALDRLTSRCPIGWQLYVMRPDGTEQRRITEGGNPFYARFSPDGRRVLYTDNDREKAVRHLDRRCQRQEWPAGLPSTDFETISLGLLVSRWEADRHHSRVDEVGWGESSDACPGRRDGPRRRSPSRSTSPRVEVTDMPDWR